MTPLPEPSEEAMRVGNYLAEFPPPGFHDRYSPRGWADLVEAVWAADDAVNEPQVDADGRPVS